MAGDRVPLVMIPRFTTYAGRATPTQCFSTIGMDVSDYLGATLNAWRGHVVGSESPGFRIWFEESTDQDAWTPCQGAPGGTVGDDPGENGESQFVLVLRKRWFRVRVQLGGRDNVCTCWAVGFLVTRRPAEEPPPESAKRQWPLQGWFRP